MKRNTSIILALMLIFCSITSFAQNSSDAEVLVKDAAKYIYETVSEPKVGSIGGEWAVMGLARSGYEISEEYYQNYYNNVVSYVKKCKGILHEKKYTEYSRVILALTAIGKNPSDVAGYNLIKPLGDYEKTTWQGINSVAWALIALDSKNYEIPKNPDATTQATREMYVDYLLDCQLADGSWNLTGKGDKGDPDVTGMVLQALSDYQDIQAVKEATDRALESMSLYQREWGGYATMDTPTSESDVQMIVALCELGISIDDPRFVKNGNTILDSLLSYRVKGKGFKHIHSQTEPNLMASEQALYALSALCRVQNGKTGLYDMIDVIINSDKDVLEGKNPDVVSKPVVSPKKTFDDIQTHKNRAAIENLASRNIINGKDEKHFEPNSTMTRAEFATIMVRGLGLSLKGEAVFDDVTPKDWFYSYVNAAYHYGIVNGVSETQFNPMGTITREEAAVMLARGAKICGMDTEYDTLYARDILAVFFDYVKISDWALSSMAFGYDSKIFSDESDEIKPQESVTRAEIAQNLYNMLYSANLMED